jgi:hypothetical protein
MDYLVKNKRTNSHLILNEKETADFIKVNGCNNYSIKKQDEKSLFINVLEWTFIIAFILFVSICIIENLPQ